MKHVFSDKTAQSGKSLLKGSLLSETVSVEADDQLSEAVLSQIVGGRKVNEYEGQH